MTNQADAYNRMEVLTANSSKLVLLMYDGAIRFAEEGIRRIEIGDISARGLYLGKSRDIVTELLSVLDTGNGGAVAQNMFRLYIYINKNLNLAIAKGDVGLVRDAVKLLSEIREGWKGAMKENPSSDIVAVAEKSARSFAEKEVRIATHA